jgi:uncharacterized phage-associated protein
MAKALDVARFLIRLATSGDEPDPLTHLRLQKLLYYAQGWSLALRGRALFTDRIEAGTHGPVVREVYHVYKGRGYASIFPAEGDEPEDLADDERELVGKVWKSLKGYSATRLRELTHREPPWTEARRGLDPAVPCNREITHESLKSYFTHVTRRYLEGQRPPSPTVRGVRADDQGRLFYLDSGDRLVMPGLEPELILRGLREHEEGQGQPLEDALAELDCVERNG